MGGGWWAGQALTGLLRRSAVQTGIAKALRSRRLPAIAELLEGLRLPHFASWRWTTLCDATQALSPMLESLAQNWCQGFFGDCRDGVAAQMATSALQSETWRLEFAFVHWFAGTMCAMGSWVGGCPCHQGMVAEHPEVCIMRGRRLAESHEYVQGQLRGILETGNSWEVSSWSSGAEFWAEAQGMIRRTYLLGQQKFKYLDELPYLVVRVDSPGVALQCLQQYDAFDEVQHHRLSRHLLARGSALRRDIEVLAAGGPMSEALREEAAPGFHSAG